MTPEDKQELRLMIREEVASVVTKLVENTPPPYLPTRKAATVLGYRDRRQLIRAVETGLLRLGKEVQDRRAPDSDKPSYYFNILACQKRLNLLPEKRKS
jgi:hypothetical protein